MIQPLLLAGGHSARMGFRKELICLNEIPVYEHQLIRLRIACPDADAVYLSLPNPSVLAPILENPRIERLTETTLQLYYKRLTFPVNLLYDDQDVGPAGGLLAAHRDDPDASWLVVACDYPFVSVSCMNQLCKEMATPVTCFENADGIHEPLLGVWSAPALSHLKENVKKGILGPKSVLKSQGKTIRTHDENCLYNVNTPAEYEGALRMSEYIASITQDIGTYVHSYG
ncbi:hypothetical protein ASPVEDRAFT_89422 [Aspergillus versicolor CBS 583.65]|uniref:MobA-like NTP transferase domain-containing protein n=1 Tax=Aspergillus versicolor CBS 583.65 TaxID=1036611 RepID=A0A1L9Q350_ASPVE|nr:uncharacterized protein ASPVEDRAFT_89422 [Aspergillus versicolor CBS 583.65]OJJ08193.1 hypothetical protein ASPVEDRAFT_89422 [Aspergillus versicolor CBS 583.65]